MSGGAIKREMRVVTDCDHRYGFYVVDIVMRPRWIVISGLGKVDGDTIACRYRVPVKQRKGEVGWDDFNAFMRMIREDFAPLLEAR